MLNYDQIDEIRFEALKKKIKNKDIALYIGASTTLVSLFFNHKACMSQEKQKKLIHYIKSHPEYRMMKARIK